MSLIKSCQRIIKYSFFLLFFLVPLILTPWNYELFEFNKMVTVYFFTTIILGSWLIKMIATGEIRIQRTPLDLPITIFLISQLLSTIFSLDRHVSIWGYYSRFHGGLLSTICYIILYYAFVTIITEKAHQNSPNSSLVPTSHGRFFLAQNSLNLGEVRKLIFIALASGFLVSFYGILEHFGIDKDLWVQDVQNRVFSTLGQPNWLAAYLCIVLPISIALVINKSTKQQKENGSVIWLFTCSVVQLFSLILPLIFYLTLLYTKSRSGFLAFWMSFFIFLFLIFRVPNRRLAGRKLAIIPIIASFLILNFIVGTPFEKINKYFTFSSLSQKVLKREVPSSPPPVGPALETGVTESGEIRRIVWKGALDIARHYPIFGAGVETFAFAYYKFKPREHNLTSEWDFLYNKAHNEYLNYAATTGFLGLTAYLFLIGKFICWSINSLIYANNMRINTNKRIISNSRKFAKIREYSCKSDTKTNSPSVLLIALLTSYISILVTNFFGFSVVIVALFFWLIPAISFVLSNILNPKNSLTIKLPATKQLKRIAMALVFLITNYYLLITLKLWYTDALFAKGNTLAGSNQHSTAYSYLQKAVNLNPGEPLYHDKLSQTLATLSTVAFLENEASLSATLASYALSHSQKAITTSPQNVNFWKTRTKLFYTLSPTNKEHAIRAIESLLVAQKLAPTDAKISYNLALLYSNGGDIDHAIETLKETINLKPNYRDAHFALALFYKEKELRQEAINELKYILEKINPKDQEVKEQFESWKM